MSRWNFYMEVFKRQSLNSCLLIVFIIIISCYVTGYNFIYESKRVKEQYSVYWTLLIMLFCLHALGQCNQQTLISKQLH